MVVKGCIAPGAGTVCNGGVKRTMIIDIIMLAHVLPPGRFS
jgi:hypothetical protein